mgnify:CR=1 FL=1
MKHSSNYLRLFFTASLLLAFFAVATAQKTVTGMLPDDETADPLIGASIVVKGTSSGTAVPYTHWTLSTIDSVSLSAAAASSQDNEL